MQYITTTKLRTHSKQLVSTLRDGGILGLVYRSEIVGVISSYHTSHRSLSKKKVSLKEFVSRFPIKSLTDVEIDQRYREALEQKHVKNIVFLDTRNSYK